MSVPFTSKPVSSLAAAALAPYPTLSPSSVSSALCHPRAMCQLAITSTTQCLMKLLKYSDSKLIALPSLSPWETPIRPCLHIPSPGVSSSCSQGWPCYLTAGICGIKSHSLQPRQARLLYLSPNWPDISSNWKGSRNRKAKDCLVVMSRVFLFSIYLICLFICLFRDKVLLCSPGWPLILLSLPPGF